MTQHKEMIDEARDVTQHKKRKHPKHDARQKK